MRQLLVMAVAVLLGIGATAQEIDQSASKVMFSIKNIKINTVDGTVKGMKGDVNFDKDNPENARFDVTVDVNTIETGIGKRDEHLKSEDFFEAEKYPTMRFKSGSVKKTADGYATTGTLTVKDVSKKVTIPFTVSGNTLTGNFTIKRKAYNVGSDVGTFKAGEDVDITIKCTLK